MGKASSSKKVARAARAAGRPGAKKNYTWPLVIGGVVVLGVIGILLSFTGGPSDASPKVGEHWHAAYGVYDCDTFATPFPQEAEDRTGIHTHGEGLMHMHPFTSRASGENANVATFADDVQLDLSDTAFSSPDINVTRKNGDECDGKKGQVQLVTWDSPSDDSATVITEDIGKHAPQNGSVWVLAFVPEGTEVPLPPSVANLQDPTALEEGRQPATATTGVPVETTDTTAATTTIPPTDETTTTTAP